VKKNRVKLINTKVLTWQPRTFSSCLYKCIQNTERYPSSRLISSLCYYRPSFVSEDEPPPTTHKKREKEPKNKNTAEILPRAHHLHSPPLVTITTTSSSSTGSSHAQNKTTMYSIILLSTLCKKQMSLSPSCKLVQPRWTIYPPPSPMVIDSSVWWKVTQTQCSNQNGILLKKKRQHPKIKQMHVSDPNRHVCSIPPNKILP